jgi:hypothetical protein
MHRRGGSWKAWSSSFPNNTPDTTCLPCLLMHCVLCPAAAAAAAVGGVHGLAGAGSESGTYFYSQGTTLTSQSWLAPFFMFGSRRVDSNMVRNLTSMRYTYKDSPCCQSATRPAPPPPPRPPPTPRPSAAAAPNPAPRSSTGRRSSSRRGRRLTAAAVAASSSTCGQKADSAQARAALQRYLGAGRGDLTWQLRLFGLDPRQLGNAFTLAVLLKKGEGRPQGRGLRPHQLRRLPGYCADWTTWSSWMHTRAGDLVRPKGGGRGGLRGAQLELPGASSSSISSAEGGQQHVAALLQAVISTQCPPSRQLHPGMHRRFLTVSAVPPSCCASPSLIHTYCCCQVDVVLDLTHCLKAAGANTSPPGAHPTPPVSPEDLVLLALDKEGAEVTPHLTFGAAGALTWSRSTRGAGSAPVLEGAQVKVMPTGVVPSVAGVEVGVVQQWGPCAKGVAVCRGAQV